jgi:hypothetical protein
VQQELLGDPGRRAPVRGGRPDLGLRRHGPVQVGGPDRLADPEVAGHHPGPSQGPGQQPLRRPAADPGERHQPLDHRLVLEPGQFLENDPPGGHRRRELGHRHRLGGRELQLAQVGHGRPGEQLGVEAPHLGEHRAGGAGWPGRVGDRRDPDLVAVAVAAGQAAAEDGGEPQGDLLGADGADHGGEQVGLEDGPDPGEAAGDPGHHRVGRGQLGQGPRGGHEPRGQGPPGHPGVRAHLRLDQQRRVGHRPQRPGGHPDHVAVHGQCPQPQPPVPPVEQVVPGPPEHLQAPGQVDRPRHRHAVHAR